MKCTPFVDTLFVKIALLIEFGHNLVRPHVDTLLSSKYPIMKELIFETIDGIWRVVFAFDPEKKAILLMAGSKL